MSIKIHLCLKENVVLNIHQTNYGKRTSIIQFSTTAKATRVYPGTKKKKKKSHCTSGKRYICKLHLF